MTRGDIDHGLHMMDLIYLFSPRDAHFVIDRNVLNAPLVHFFRLCCRCAVQDFKRSVITCNWCISNLNHDW